jgi:hypothetical protein
VGHDAIVGGTTRSTDFPVTGNAFQDDNAGGRDAFISRLDTDKAGPAGLEVSTYLGGSGNDIGRGVAVRPPTVFLTGGTTSPDFPVSENAYDDTFNGVQDAFISRLTFRRVPPVRLLYSTYVGGSGDDFSRGLVMRGTDAFITGFTDSADYPTENAYDPSFNGGQDGFVTRIDTTPKKK